MRDINDGWLITTDMDAMRDLRQAVQHLEYWGIAWVRPDIQWQDAYIKHSRPYVASLRPLEPLKGN
jgi:hypothetical protein